MPDALPLLGKLDDTGGPIAWWRGRPVTREAFLGHVQCAADSLSDRRLVINLCEDRYLFLVLFAATIASGRTNLLPPSRVGGQVQDVARAYPDHQIVADAGVEAVLGSLSVCPGEIRRMPWIAADHLAAVVFTSGSTGHAQAHRKFWGSLVGGADCAQRRFEFHDGKPAIVVATVPPQHMYGLETSILVPLVCGISMHAGRPFYAEDIRAALAEVSGRRILITTPVHLRVCVDSGLSWPRVEFIISATAPLPVAQAARAEAIFDCPVLEIYGCTEAGSMASRRTVTEDLWRTYAGMSVCRRGELFYAQSGYLSEPVVLNDLLILHDETHFGLTGRRADLVNVAGKRASLSDLAIKLTEIEGVNDGVFLTPPEDGGQDGKRVHRLMALVVAPGLREKQIIESLAERIDPAFMPRPLYKVERLPRNALGKLPRAALFALVRRLREARDAV